MVFLILDHFIPKCHALGAITGIDRITVLDAPERFVLLHELTHEVVEMIVVHRKQYE